MSSDAVSIPVSVCLIVAYTGQAMDIDIYQTRKVSFSSIH